MKCQYCNQKSTKYHCNHKTGENEYLCDYHYSTWHEIEHNQKEQCFICKDFSKTIEHHISYLPQTIICVCESCHKKIHSGKLPEFAPKSRRHKLIFYSHKGHLVFESHKNQKRIPIKSYDKKRKDGYIWTHQRLLNEKEKFLRKEMLKEKSYLVE